MKKRLISWLLVLTMLTSFLVSVPAIADTEDVTEQAVTEIQPGDEEKAEEADPETLSGDVLPEDTGDEAEAKGPDEPADEPEEDEPDEPADEPEEEEPDEPADEPEEEEPDAPADEPEEDEPDESADEPEEDKSDEPADEPEEDEPDARADEPDVKGPEPEQPGESSVQPKEKTNTVLPADLTAFDSVTATIYYNHQDDTAQIGLVWYGDGCDAETGIRIYRSTDNGQYVYVDDAGTSGNEWFDDNVELMHSYRYALCRYNDEGDETVEGSRTESNEVSPRYALPDIKDFSSYLSNYGNSYYVECGGMIDWDSIWRYDLGIEAGEGIRVRRSVNGGEFTEIDAENMEIFPGYEDMPRFSDRNIVVGNTYQYKFDVYMMLDGEPVYGNETVSDLFDLRPTTDVEMTVSAACEATGEPQIEVSIKTARNESKPVGPTGLRIRRRIDGGNWTELTTKITSGFYGTTLLYTDPVTLFGTYEYEVTAYATVNETTTYGTPAVTDPQTISPSAPKDFTATLTSGKASLSWTLLDNNINVKNYIITREVNGGEEEVLTTRNGGTSKYTDNNPVYGRNVYKLKAVILQNDEEIITQEAICTLDRIPPVPENFTITITEDGIRLISWNAPEGITGYRLTYGDSSSTYYYSRNYTSAYLSNFVQQNLSADTVSFTVQNLIRGRYFHARIESYVAVGGEEKLYSSANADYWSSEGTRYAYVNRIQLATPAVTITVNGDENHIEWQPVENAYKYRIYYRDGGESSWNETEQLARYTDYDDNEGTPGVMRAYKVQALAADNSDYTDSEQSDIVWALTEEYDLPDDFSLVKQDDGSLLATVTSTDGDAQYVLSIDDCQYVLTADEGTATSCEIAKPRLFGEQSFTLDMQVIDGDGNWYSVGTSNTVSLTLYPRKPSKPNYSANSISSLNGWVYDQNNTYYQNGYFTSSGLMYQWIMDGTVIQETPVSGYTHAYDSSLGYYRDITRVEAKLNDLTLECGSSHSLTIRAVYTDESGRSFVSPESDQVSFSIPTIPDEIEIVRNGNYIRFAWDTQEDLAWRIWLKGPDDEQPQSVYVSTYTYWGYSSTYEQTETQTIVNYYPSRPDSFGHNTICVAFEANIFSSYVEINRSQTYEFTVGPVIPAIGQVVSDGGQAVLKLSGIEYATGFEVEQDGLLLDTVPAVAEDTTNYTVPVTLDYGHDTVFRARTYYMDPVTEERYYSDWAEKTIYIPEMPANIQIIRDPNYSYYSYYYAYFDLTFKGDENSYYRVSTIYTEEPDEYYFYSDSYDQAEAETTYDFQRNLPDHLGRNYFRLRITTSDYASNSSFIGYTDPISFSVAPNCPAIGAVTLENNKATLAVGNIRHATGFEVEQDGVMLDTVPAIQEGTTEYTFPVTLTHGRNMVFRARTYYTDPETQEIHYSEWTEKKIYIPKMPTGLAITQKNNSYVLSFKGDTKSWYALSYLRPGAKTYTSYSYRGEKVAAKTETDLYFNRPDNIGANKVKVRIANTQDADYASFIGYLSPASFSVGPYMPSDIYVNYINDVNGKASIVLYSYYNSEVNPCYLQLYLNGKLAKTITCSKNKTSYETSISFAGLEGKVIQLKARVYTVKNNVKYYSAYLVENYVGEPRNVQLTPWGLGVKITWDPAYGATNYDASIRGTVNNKEKIYVQKLNAKSGVILKSDKLPVKNDLRVHINAWVKTDGTRYQREYHTWHWFTPRSPQVSISNTKKAISLDWPKMNGIDGFEVQRSLHYSTGYRRIGNYLKGTATGYTDKTVKRGKTYYYRVRSYCFNSSGKKVYSDFSYSVETSIDYPTAPTLSVSHSMKTIDLEWNKVDCDGYLVYRYSDKEDAEIVAVLPKTKRSYTDKTKGKNKIVANRQYYYWVTAYYGNTDEEMYSSSSNTVSDSLRPDTPTKVKVKQKDSSSATVSWKAVSGAKKYEIWMRTNDPEGKLKKVAVVKGTNETVSGLKSGNIYYFVVRAIAGKAIGDYCDNVILRMK